MFKKIANLFRKKRGYVDKNESYETGVDLTSKKWNLTSEESKNNSELISQKFKELKQDQQSLNSVNLSETAQIIASVANETQQSAKDIGNQFKSVEESLSKHSSIDGEIGRLTNIMNRTKKNRIKKKRVRHCRLT